MRRVQLALTTWLVAVVTEFPSASELPISEIMTGEVFLFTKLLNAATSPTTPAAFLAAEWA